MIFDVSLACVECKAEIHIITRPAYDNFIA